MPATQAVQLLCPLLAAMVPGASPLNFILRKSLERLWSCLGTYLKLIKQRGQVETDQKPNDQKQDDQSPTNP